MVAPHRPAQSEPAFSPEEARMENALRGDPRSRATLELFAEEITAIYEREVAALDESDAHSMNRLVKLSRYCEARGRRLIAESRDPRDIARGIWLLASHYIMEITNGHAVSHRAYDDLPGSRVDSASYEWQTMVVGADWSVDHNEVHHPFTNQAGKDDDYGFLILRVSGKQPWRVVNLIQPLLLATLPLYLTGYFPGFLAMARARYEGRPILSRQTLEKPARKVGAQWWRNYVREPLRAGPRAPLVAAANWAAKLLSNTYITYMLGVEHHAENLLDFDEDPNEPVEVMYLRQILGTTNFTTTPEHEDLYTLGVNIHTEHHLFPDLPMSRLRKVSEDVQATCEKYGIPYNSQPWPKAIAGLWKSVLLYSLPIRTTGVREKRRRLFERLVDELRIKRGRRHLTVTPPAPEPVVEHTVTLAKTGRTITAPSDRSLLETLEQAGVNVQSGCRKGACKTCVTRKLSGRTSLETRRTRDKIELCVARPVGDVELDL